MRHAFFGFTLFICLFVLSACTSQTKSVSKVATKPPSNVSPKSTTNATNTPKTKVAAKSTTKVVNPLDVIKTSTTPSVVSGKDFVTNQQCIDIIKQFEGVRLDAYRGPAGHWLIGYGHKAGVVQGMKISPEQAETMLQKDLREFEDNVKRVVKVGLNQNQFSALVCISYNIGSGNFARSTLVKELNRGKYLAAADQFSVWRRANGKINSHLVERRAIERDLFLK